MGRVERTTPEFPSIRSTVWQDIPAIKLPNTAAQLPGPFAQLPSLRRESALAAQPAPTQEPARATELAPDRPLTAGPQATLGPQPTPAPQLADFELRMLADPIPCDNNVSATPGIQFQQLAHDSSPNRSGDLLHRRTRADEDRVKKNRSPRKEAIEPPEDFAVEKFIESILNTGGGEDSVEQSEPQQTRLLQRPARRSSAIFSSFAALDPSAEA